MNNTEPDRPVEERIDEMCEKTLYKFYQGKMDYASATGLISKQIDIARQVNWTSVGKAYNVLAILNNEIGEYDKAHGYFEQAKAAFEQEHYTKGIASALTNLGEVMRETGKFDEAIAYYRQARDIAEQSNQESHVIFAICNEGYARLQQRQVEWAIELLTEGMARAHGMKHSDPDVSRRLLPEILSNLAKAYTQKHAFDTAWDYAERALNAAQKYEDQHEIGHAYQVMATIATMQGKSSQRVEGFFQAAEQSWVRINAIPELGRLHFQAAQYWEDRGIVNRAQKSYKQARNYFTRASMKSQSDAAHTRFVRLDSMTTQEIEKISASTGN